MSACTVCDRSDQPTTETPIGPVCPRCNIPVVMGPLLAKARPAAPTHTAGSSGAGEQAALVQIGNRIGEMSSPITLIGGLQMLAGGLYLLAALFLLANDGGPNAFVLLVVGVAVGGFGTFIVNTGVQAGRTPFEPTPERILAALDLQVTYWRLMAALALLGLILGGFGALLQNV